MRTLTLFTLILLSLPLSADAARFYFDGAESVRTGETILVTLMLDTEGEDINALEGTVLVSGALNIAGIREEESIVSMWIERPAITGSGTVYFSGIIPGGFSGVLSPFWEGSRPGAVYTLLIEGGQEGTGRLTLAPAASVLRNDGNGSRVPVMATDIVVTVSKDAAIVAAPPDDREPPEEFVPTRAQDPDVLGGAYFLAFSTIDLASGIDHYEVAETRTRFGAPVYARAESPYQLQDQSGQSYVYVKAVDRAGNERVATLAPEQSNPWTPYVWFILLALIAIVAVHTIILRRRHEPNA